MIRKLTYHLLFAATTILPLQSLTSATITWQGPTNPINVGTNWVGNVAPGAADTANFAGANPTIGSLNSTNFSVTGFTFSGASYNIIANGGGATGTTKILTGTGGVAATTASSFLITNGANIEVNNSSLSSGSALMTYNIGNAPDTAPASMTVSGSTLSGDTVINLTGSATVNPTLDFLGTSSLSSSKINALDHAIINVNTSTAASVAVVSLANTSNFNLLQSVTIDTISSDVTSNINLGSNTLTLGTANGIIAGPIVGTGSLSVADGLLSLTSPGNTYSGGTSVGDVATVIGDSTSLQGAFDLNNSGNLNFTQNSDGIFNGSLAGAAGSAVTKTGSGKLVLLTPSSTFQGTATVLGGTLNVNTILGGNVVVGNGSTLSGIFQILGNATIQGTISPGNSIATVAIAGDYTQASSGIYKVEIQGDGTSDRIIVGGDADLAGTVHVISLDGVINFDTNYVIMHVNGTLTGQFDAITEANPFLFGQVFYIPDAVNGGTNVILKVETIFSALAVTPNQIQVANQLNSITAPTPALIAALTQIGALAVVEPALAQAALNQLTGMQYTNIAAAVEINSHQFIRRLYDPLRSIVTNSPCYDPCDCCTSSCPTFDAWLEAGGGRTFLEGTSDTRGFHMDEYQITGGVQSTFNRDWTAGLAGSYVNDEVSYNVGGSGKNQTAYVGLYGLYRPTNWYVLADAAFGYSEYKVRRSISLNTLQYNARSKPELYQGLGYLEGGIDVPWNCLLLQPFLGFEVSYFDRKGFTESGSSPFNLVVNKKSHTNVFSRLGFHITSNQLPLDLLPFNVSFSMDLAWQYRITRPGSTIYERFETFGSTFKIKGLHFRRSSLDVAATITARVLDNVDVYIEGGAEKWSRASTYNFLGGVKFSW